jgi:integrase
MAPPHLALVPPAISSSSPPGKKPRRPYQRTISGGYVSEIVHPLYGAPARLRVTGATVHELEESLRILSEWKLEYRRAALERDEFERRLVRWATPRTRMVTVRAAFDALAEIASPEHQSKLASIYRHMIAPDLGELLVTRVTALRLSAWETHLAAADYARSSIEDAFAYLGQAVKLTLPEGQDLPWLVSPGHYWRPHKGRVARLRPACGTVAQAEAILAVALEEDRAGRARGMFADLGARCVVALLLGLRNGELAGLGWDDFVDLWGPEPRVVVRHQAIDQWRRLHPGWTRPSQAPKGCKTRELRVHPTAVLALSFQREQLVARGWWRPDGPVFPGHTGTPFEGMWRNNANAIPPERMKRLAESAGLAFPQEWVTHSLRHSLATLESTSGADLRSIQRRTGHGSLAVLETYVHGRSGRALPPSAVPALDVSFDHETKPCPPPTLPSHEKDPQP